MNGLQIFARPEFGQLRWIEKDGYPWFVAADVCAALGLGNVGQAVSTLDDDEKSSIDANIISNDVDGGRAPLIISEPGLYSLVLRSRKPEAKSFKRWVTHEVLPSIRRHGMYATPQTVEAMIEDPDTAIRLLETIKTERKKVATLEAKAAADRPKVLFADAVDSSSTSILVGDLAKLLRQNGTEMGQNRLFEWMRRHGFLMSHGESRNMPTQRGMEMGLFEIKERTINNPDGSIRITKTTKVTGKGQIYFVNRLAVVSLPTACAV